MLSNNEYGDDFETALPVSTVCILRVVKHCFAPQPLWTGRSCTTFQFLPENKRLPSTSLEVRHSSTSTDRTGSRIRKSRIHHRHAEGEQIICLHQKLIVAACCLECGEGHSSDHRLHVGSSSATPLKTKVHSQSTVTSQSPLRRARP